MWWWRIKKDLSRILKKAIELFGSEKFIFEDERGCLTCKSITSQSGSHKAKAKIPKRKNRKMTSVKMKKKKPFLKSFHSTQWEVEKWYAITIQRRLFRLIPSSRWIRDWEKAAYNLRWKSTIISQKCTATEYVQCYHSMMRSL